ncbi:MAG: hypothetical protein GY832_19015 [Chloroflexi bacterium]|nr:hypothetical protein [Chloroflexota bacterium]
MPAELAVAADAPMQLRLRLRTGSECERDGSQAPTGSGSGSLLAPPTHEGHHLVAVAGRSDKLAGWYACRKTYRSVAYGTWTVGAARKLLTSRSDFDIKQQPQQNGSVSDLDEPCCRPILNRIRPTTSSTTASPYCSHSERTHRKVFRLQNGRPECAPLPLACQVSQSTKSY